MARALAPIPLGTPIADEQGGITTFFRLRWQELIDGWSKSGSVQQVSTAAAAKTAALATLSVLTVTATGDYRVTWYLRKTRADGAASSATVTIGFQDVDGQALTYAGVALTLDTALAWQSDTKQIRCGAFTDITVAVAYTSTTPGQMRYDLQVRVEALV